MTSSYVRYKITSVTPKYRTGGRQRLRTLNIVSWNVNGIRAAYKKGFLDWLSDASPDILCIQETKANEEQLPEELRQVDGYRAYFASAEKKGYSGVAMYTKIEPISVQRGFGIGRFDSEGRTIQADFGRLPWGVRYAALMGALFGGLVPGLATGWGLGALGAWVRRFR